MAHLTRAQFWDKMPVRAFDLYAPAMNAHSRTGRGQIISSRSFGSDLWTGTITLKRTRHTQAREVQALLMLAGQAGNTVEIGPCYLGPTGNGVVSAINTNNRRVSVTGMVPGTAFPAGSYIQITPSGFYTTTAALIVNGAGGATFDVVPHLRPGTAAGQAVVTARPVFKAIVIDVRAGTFGAMLAGETSFDVMQVLE